MAKERERGSGQSGPHGTLAPTLRVSVAAAPDTDLTAVTRLVKPAVLYADHVTVHSPAVSLVEAIRSFGDLSGPQQASVLQEVFDQVPALRGQMDDLLAEVHADTGQINEAAATVVELLGGHELVIAVKANAVRVTNLFGDDTLADVFGRPLQDGDAGSTDAVLQSFVTKLWEIVTDPQAFPLLDGSSADYVRMLETAGELAPHPRAMLHGAEVGVATGSMGFLPSFPDLPMYRVLDLRSVLKNPLTRFRVEMAHLAKELDARPVDTDFDAEVADAWRVRIEPSLRELREVLADNGLLRSAAAVISGSYEALVAEVGGAVTVGHMGTWDIVWTAASAAAAPMGHLAVQATRRHLQAQKTAQGHGLYFLHRLDREAKRHIV